LHVGTIRTNIFYFPNIGKWDFTILLSIEMKISIVFT